MKSPGGLLLVLLLSSLWCSNSSEGQPTTKLSFLSLGGTANTPTETLPGFNDAVSSPIEIAGGLFISNRNVTTAYVSLLASYSLSI